MPGENSKAIRIGNGAGFWGDSIDAPRRLVENSELDYLTLEYLAELTLSILAHQKNKAPHTGFVTDVPFVVESIVDALKTTHLKVVTNGGGMNPPSCAKSVARILVEQDLEHFKIGVCQGDDLLPQLNELVANGEQFLNFETGKPLGELKKQIASANAYLGAAGIVKALEQDAKIVLTGRIADASLVVGPAAFEHQWSLSDFEKLGKATVAGHLIECGAQVTGGIYSNWSSEISIDLIGYPIAEIFHSGDCTITKPENSDGIVNCETVAEQLVYEIGDPKNYMTPDVIADFANVQLQQLSDNAVSVTGGSGTARPKDLKVSMAYYDGFAVSGMIVLAGPNAVENARASAEMIRKRVASSGFELDQFHFEILGAGDSLAGKVSSSSPVSESETAADSQKVPNCNPWEVVLRIAARDSRREAVDRLAREIAPLVTSGPPAVTGYTGARNRSHQVLAYWPSTIAQEKLDHQVTVKTAKEWIDE